MPDNLHAFEMGLIKKNNAVSEITGQVVVQDL